MSVANKKFGQSTQEVLLFKLLWFNPPPLVLKGTMGTKVKVWTCLNDLPPLLLFL